MDTGETLILKRTKEYLKKGWCQHSLAMTKDDKAVTVHDPEAIKWCLIGAIFRASDDIRNEFPETRCHDRAPMSIIASLIKEPVPTWNDAPGRRKEDVLKLIETAISASINSPAL